MKLNVFEAFSGIGAQRKAIDFLNKNFGTEYKIVATSDWDIWANISYNTIHFKNDLSPSIEKDPEEMKEFLNKFTHSANSKTPIRSKIFNKMLDDDFFLKTLYSSYKKSNNLGSITEITAEKLLENLPNNEKIDMIFYSFPCQDLSSAGKNKGMAVDGNTRSGLLWQIDRILDQLKELGKLPKFLLLENVMNMISVRHKDEFYIWIDNLKEKFGYETQYYIMNALDYDLPQNRKRVYGLSMIPELDKGENFQTVKKSLSNFKEPLILHKDKKTKNLNVQDFLRVNYEDSKIKQEAEESRPMHTPSRIKMWEQNPKLYSLIYPENTKNYSRTITTKQDRNPNAGNIDLQGTILANKELIQFETKANYRFLTPRECFLLMGFDDDDYDEIANNKLLKNKKEVLYRQAGNSIAVNVLEHLFWNIYKKYWSN